MAQKHRHLPGLIKRGEIWHIDKQVDGQRIRKSSGSIEFLEAQRYLIRTLETHRQATIYGIRPRRTFDTAAARFINEHYHKRSIQDDVGHLKQLMPTIGNQPLDNIHMGTLQPFIEARKKQGVKAQTINHALQIVRHILNLSATEWIDLYGLTWLNTAPKIKLLALENVRKPYPLDWQEQERLFSYLPAYLKDMALFAANTGCRDQEICTLQWCWEAQSTGSKVGSVFVIPGARVKNTQDRLVILNKIARSVIDKQRGNHPQWVFVHHNKPLSRMLNRAWRQARIKAELPHVRVHDLKHTFGKRLRGMGVSFEDRQDLLGHKSARITTHYSSAERLNLWRAANKVCTQKD